MSNLEFVTLFRVSTQLVMGRHCFKPRVEGGAEFEIEPSLSASDLQLLLHLAYRLHQAGRLVPLGSVWPALVSRQRSDVSKRRATN